MGGLPRRGASGGGRDSALMVIEQCIRYAGLAVGLMEIENVIRYPALAVGLKPSAMECEARLRGLCWSIIQRP